MLIVTSNLVIPHYSKPSQFGVSNAICTGLSNKLRVLTCLRSKILVMKKQYWILLGLWTGRDIYCIYIYIHFYHTRGWQRCSNMLYSAAVHSFQLCPIARSPLLACTSKESPAVLGEGGFKTCFSARTFSDPWRSRWLRSLRSGFRVTSTPPVFRSLGRSWWVMFFPRRPADVGQLGTWNPYKRMERVASKGGTKLGPPRKRETICDLQSF